MSSNEVPQAEPTTPERVEALLAPVSAPKKPVKFTLSSSSDLDDPGYSAHRLGVGPEDAEGRELTRMVATLFDTDDRRPFLGRDQRDFPEGTVPAEMLASMIALRAKLDDPAIQSRIRAVYAEREALIAELGGLRKR